MPLDPGVYHGDAHDLLPSVELESVRLVLTDPPFNTSRKNNFHTMGRRGIDFKWDGGFNQLKWLKLVNPLLLPGASIVIWNDWKNLGLIGEHLDALNCETKRPLIWTKTNPMPRNIDRSVVQANEFGLWATKNGAKWVFNRQKKYEDFNFTYAVPRAPAGRPRHDSAKPVSMMREIITVLTNPNDLVLDPFCGSGPVAVACALTNRRCISFEKDKKWVDETNLRVQEALQKKQEAAPQT